MSTNRPQPATDTPTLAEQATVRLRLVGTAAVVGAAVAAVGLAVSTLTRALTSPVDTTFVLGTLVFGFGLLGWSGAVALGRGIESMQDHLDTDTGWTESDGRRAMARILGFGFGVMLGTVVVGSAL